MGSAPARIHLQHIESGAPARRDAAVVQRSLLVAMFERRLRSRMAGGLAVSDPTQADRVPGMLEEAEPGARAG
ncbi:hypothetical protein Mame01_56380 [Microbispora amethystogenes]|nr:hypothetical protein Mame01_56380 [Microbispora amethystogenes]